MIRYLKITNRSNFLITRTPNFEFCKKESNNINEEDKQKKPMKITYGKQFHHPLRKMLLSRINQNFKKQKGKNYISAQMLSKKQKNDIKDTIQKIKKKQQEEEASGKKNENNKNYGTRIFQAFVFTYLGLQILQVLMPEQNEQMQQGVTEYQVNSQQLIKQIESNSAITKVVIQRSFYSPIKVILVTQSKLTVVILNEVQLAKFLKQLENVRGGNIIVQFNFPTVPGLSKYAKQLVEYTYLATNLIIIGVVITIYRRFKNDMGSGIQQLFKMQKFKPVRPEQIELTFKDVAGMHEAKFQVTQFVDFLKEPEKYIDMGAKVPKGALLTGPPGTGKTMLAKACAGEAGVPFFYVSGSDFVEKYAGLGASRVRSLFDEAQKNSPSIIFIDEIDAIGKKRNSGPFSNQQRDNTLNQLLVRMDGFDTSNKVIVMAATNRKDMLDPALLRPGRFDRSVEIGIPNFEERKQILKVHLKKVSYDTSLSEDQIAKKIALITPGFSGAQLANTCNQAAILAARDNLNSIPFAKFEKATQRVMAGLQKRNIFTEQEKQMLAYYESGKTVVSWFTEGSDPVIKISILPFSKSNKGYSHSIRDQTALHTMDELLAKASCYLAGRAAQEHFKGYVTTNGDKDLERARKIITMIITKFGMSESLNMIAFPDFDFTRKPYSEKVQSLIDQQIQQLTKLVHDRVQKIIKQKESLILAVRQKLLKLETLSHNDIKQILGARPFESNQNYQQYLKDEEEQKNKEANGPGATTAFTSRIRQEQF